MEKFKGKKLLILGGKPIGSCEIVKYAQSEGAYVIVADYLSDELSPAKQLADETWNISTADINRLALKIKEFSIDGIYTGVHEFNIRRMIEICQLTGLPCYCSKEKWNQVENKELFKEMCREYEIPVTKEYRISLSCFEDQLEEIEYPVVVKPVDGSGSRGFSICTNCEELKEAYKKGRKFSESGEVLVEQFMNYKNSVIINYTLVDGEIIYSGMGDKCSKKIGENGAPIMASVIYPSLFEKQYIDELNDKVKRMFKCEGYQNGVIWIEAFYNNEKFVFNEMGYRFGGSLTYYPVEYRTGINQLKLQVDYALSVRDKSIISKTYKSPNDVYMVLPVHVKPGKIAKIEGIEEIKKSSYFYQIVYVHYIGDEIQDWGSAQQVFAYIHYLANNRKEVEFFAKYIINTLKVYDEDGNNMIFNLYI